MLQVSDSATSLLSELLEGQAEPGQLFRLDKKDDGFELAFGVVADGDVLFQHEETDVLAVAPGVAETLDGLTIDREDSQEGPRLVLVE